MMHKSMLQEELERVDTLSIVEVAAYVNRLSRQLERDDCTDDERRNGLVLLARITERVRFLKVTLKPALSRTVWSH